MNFKNVLKKINEAFLFSGYARTAQELYLLSDRQLDDLGISRALLKRGANSFPWRVEEQAQAIPDNVSQLNAAKDAATSSSSVNQTPVMPKTPKAA